MKRSYDYSFVQLDDTHGTQTTPTHSLCQSSATLATHPFFTPGHFVVNTPAGPSASYVYEVPNYSTAQCLIQDNILGDNDFDLQSNVWYQPTTTPERNFWRSHVSSLATSITPRQPLTGLGITFGYSDARDIRSVPPHIARAYAEHIRQGSTDSDNDIALRQSHKRKASALHEDITEMVVDSSSDGSEGVSAYSSCPSQDYPAHSSSGIIDPSPFYRPYSPVEDLLTLVGASTPLSAVMNDLPRSFVLSTPELAVYYDTEDSVSVQNHPQAEHTMVGIVADVNYRTLARQTQSPIMCVNPADISAPMDDSTSVKMEEDTDASGSPGILTVESCISPSNNRPRSISPDMHADFPQEALSAVVSVLAESVKQEKAAKINATIDPMEVSHQRERLSTSALPLHMRQLNTRETSSYPTRLQSLVYPTRSGYGLGLQLSASNVSTPTQVLDTRTALATLPPAVHRVPLAPITHIQPMQSQVQHRQAPILNAHEGVELEDLRLRAETFRMLNAGCELDKTFLQAFAGRLSEKGQMLHEFRCYVKGCTQRNKRRDHILVHVGSHVEHRPFQCPQCGMRFLRKNECKRHMSSHGGFKPYVCTLCAPYQEKSFVRQDLLKRHMKVTHGVKPEYWPDRRRRTKTTEQEEVETSPSIDNYNSLEGFYMMDVVSQ